MACTAFDGIFIFKTFCSENIYVLFLSNFVLFQLISTQKVTLSEKTMREERLCQRWVYIINLQFLSTPIHLILLVFILSPHLSWWIQPNCKIFNRPLKCQTVPTHMQEKSENQRKTALVLEWKFSWKPTSSWQKPYSFSIAKYLK